MTVPPQDEDDAVFYEEAQPKPPSLIESCVSQSIPEATSPRLASPSLKSVEDLEDCFEDGAEDDYLEEDEDVEEEEEDAVYMNCICNNNETCDEMAVMCTYCEEGFHARCCGLDEEDCNDLESTNMTWACPRCRESQEQSPVELEALHEEGEEEPEAVAELDILPEEEEEKPEAVAELEVLPEEEEEEASKQERQDEEAEDLFPLSGVTQDRREKMESTSKLEENDFLSLTAQLEALHQEECGEHDSFLFARPLLPQARKKVPMETELSCQPGKNWRRSMMAAKQSLPQQKKPPRASFIIVPNVPTVSEGASRTITGLGGPGDLPSRAQSVQQGRKRSHHNLLSRLEEDETEDSAGDRGVDPPLDVGVSAEPVRSLSTLFSSVSLIEEGAQVGDDGGISKLLSLCTESDIVRFENIYDEKTLSKSTKLGEGAFGEVFAMGTEDREKPVLKVVPVGGTIEVNGDEQTKLEEISSEVLISSILSDLRAGQVNTCEGFVELRRCFVFQGKYPEKLLELWDQFANVKGTENDRPDVFPEEQLYIALEYGNGGKDLEKFVFKNPDQAFAAWNQVAHTLAVAEHSYQFEHRDLHWGNVLIKDTKEKNISFTINGETFPVATGGIKTHIIDFSLSRLEDQEGIVFKDLSQDPDLFRGQGVDKGGDFQFDVYRMQRRNNGDDWEKFSPKTNIFWLQYLMKKMIQGVHYQSKNYKSKKSKSLFLKQLEKLKEVESDLENYSSASELVMKMKSHGH